ncbi:Uncharacterised protein [Neisseria meningitidis]|nr:Uncharacterised protein [Neisseria meningitidis]CWQ39343.1 Uncharacterised protein [Neisseria meningitidis]
MAMNIIDVPTKTIDRLSGSYFRNTTIRINKQQIMFLYACHDNLLMSMSVGEDVTNTYSFR